MEDRVHIEIAELQRLKNTEAAAKKIVRFIKMGATTGELLNSLQPLVEAQEMSGQYRTFVVSRGKFLKDDQAGKFVTTLFGLSASESHPFGVANISISRDEVLATIRYRATRCIDKPTESQWAAVQATLYEVALKHGADTDTPKP